MQLKNLLVPIATIMILSSPVAVAELGFYKDLNKHPAVQRTKASIFKVYAPNFETYGSFENPEEDIKRLNQMSDDELPKPERLLLIAQIRRCSELMIKPCIVETGSIRGTAFLLDDGKTLATVFHNIDLHLINLRKIYRSMKRPLYEEGEMEKQKALFSTLNFPLILVNAEGKVVWGEDPAQRVTQLNLKWEMLKRRKLDGDLRAEEDWALLKLNQSLGEGLKLASAPPKFGERVFTGGFPQVTETRAEFKRPDSDGESFYFTLGEALDPALVDQRLAGGAAGPRQSGLLPGPGMIMGGGLMSHMRGCSSTASCFYTTADGQSGLSGAPFLNERGEVIGIAADGLPVDEQDVTPETRTFWGPTLETLRAGLKELLSN